MAGWFMARLRGGGSMLVATLFVLLLGLAMGLAAPHNVDAATLERTRLLVGNYIQTLPEYGVSPLQESAQALLLNGCILAVMALCGLHLLGVPLSLAVLFLKGLSLGYAMSFLLDYQGASGFAVIFLSMLPQHLLLLPAFVLAAYLAACFSLSLFRVRPLSPGLFGVYGLRFTVLLAVVALAALIQGYICPLLLKMFFVII